MRGMNSIAPGRRAFSATLLAPFTAPALLLAPTLVAPSLLMPSLLMPSAAQAQRARYAFDHEGGQVGFSARHMGLFSSHGSFERFRAALALDPAAPGNADVDVTIETGFVSLPWPGATDLLRSEAYFDVAQHPTARFVGRAEGVADQGAFPVRGLITVRGIQRPLVLQARLAARRREAAGEVAAFTAAGEILRSEFGMTADRTLISDRIMITVNVRILV